MFLRKARVLSTAALALALCLPLGSGALAAPELPGMPEQPGIEGTETEAPPAAPSNTPETNDDGAPPDGDSGDSAPLQPGAPGPDLGDPREGSLVLPEADIDVDNEPQTPVPSESIFPSEISGPHVTHSRLNLRSGPGTGFPVLRVLPVGAPVTVSTASLGSWQEVTSRGTTGWLNVSYLDPAPGVLATTGGVNLRGGPSTTYSSITVLPGAAPVRILGDASGNWWRVSAEGATGWMSISYLTALTPAPDMTTARVNFRSGPGVSHSSLRVLPENTPVTPTGQVEGSWIRVMAKSTVGWISASYVHAAPATGWYTTANLNMRSGPGTSYAKVGTLYSNSAATLTGSASGNWWQVRAGSTTGWVSTSYLTRTKPPVTTPDCQRLKCIALTFDDGPGPYTTRLLNILAEQHVPATFFLMGQKVAPRASVVTRMAREGHEIGSHTWSHPSLVLLSNAGIRQQVDQADAAIRAVTGQTPTMLRPPYGARDARVDSVVGKPLILWDVDTRDWEHKKPAQTIAITMRDARRGSIVLMHDVHSTTVDAVPNLISRLRAEGYTFVTVTQLFAPQRLQPGRYYYRAV